MRTTLAIALLALRSAFRSRMVACLLLLLMAVVVFVPMTIKGDGTVAGHFQILVSYTLGLASFILALTALWAGSASVSSEIGDKTLQMVIAKPVTRGQVWLGKWLGLNLLNIFLLAACGAVACVMLYARLHPSRISDQGNAAEAARLFSAREEIFPAFPDLDMEAEGRLASLPAPPADRTIALQDIRQQLLVEHLSLPAGGEKAWRFFVPDGIPAGQTLTLQYRFASSRVGQSLVTGSWQAGTPSQPALAASENRGAARSVNEFTFTTDDRWSGHELVLVYKNLDPDGASLLFDAGEGLVLLVPRGGFLANYLRALLGVLGQLAFFTALGVSAGCILSLPVASFTSLSLFALVHMGTYLQGLARAGSGAGHLGPDGAAGWSEALSTAILKVLGAIMAPLVQAGALDRIATGRIIDPASALAGFLLQGLVYSLVIGFLSVRVMNRRELALPASS